MAALGYEFASLTRERYFQHVLEDNIRISPSGHVMFCLFIDTDEIPTKTQLEAYLRMHLWRRECRHEKLAGV